MANPKNRPPGIRKLFRLPFGAAKRARRDSLKFFLECSRRYGDVFNYRLGPWDFYLLSHPDHVKYILHDNHANYPRSRFYNRMKAVLGEGLVTSEGAVWRSQRRQSQPVFVHRQIAALAGPMAEMIAATLERWHPYVASGEAIEVLTEMKLMALRVAGKVLVGEDLGGEGRDIVEASSVMVDYINFKMDRPLSLPTAFPTPRNLQFRRSKRLVENVLEELVAARRRDAGGRPRDLLSVILETSGEGEGAAGDRDVRDRLITFMGAGHETVAVALSWTWYLLARHPEVAGRVRKELSEVLAGRTPTFEELQGLTYCRQVIQESMRLYPPIYGLLRDAVEDDEIGGFHIPSRAIVVLSQYVTHRHLDFWDDPERFDPDRFDAANSACRPPLAYFPFGGGPHQCIGNEFAMTEIVLAFAMVSQRYRLELVEGHSVEQRASFTLRFRYGLRMRIVDA